MCALKNSANNGESIFTITYFLDSVYEKLENGAYNSKGEVEDDIIKIHELCSHLQVPEDEFPPYIHDAEEDLMILRSSFDSE